MAMLAIKFALAASMVLPLSVQTVSKEMASHAQAAHEAEQRGDFLTAVHEYESLIRMLPRSAEMHSNLGVALYFDHQWDRAIAVFRQAIVLNPELLAPHLFSGLAWYQLSKPDAAVPELEAAIRIHSSDVIAHTWLGYAYSAQSRYEAAAAEFEEVSKLDPNNLDAWYSLGQSYLQIGNDETRKLLMLAPDGGRAWQLAGEQAHLQGNQQKAREDFEQANARRPEIPEVRVTLVAMGGKPTRSALDQRSETSREDEIYHRAHDAEQKSRSAFERVLSLAPDSYRAHQIMAYAFVTQEQYDKAIAEYRLVLNQKPDMPEVHEAIGNCLLRNGKTEEALHEFEAELRLQPYSASANTNVGQVMLIMGRDNEAEKALTNALRMDRPPPEVYRLLGKLDLHRKDYSSAVRNLTRYLSMQKDDATAYYLLSRAYRGLGDQDQMKRSLSLFEKTSQDAKARSHAQGELERLTNQSRIDDEVMKREPSSNN
ncbi:MAG: tetratricopeptide repeat protein [Candidatus Sulfotelmatobacter sp.]